MTVSPCCEVCGGVCGVGGVKCVGCVEWVYCVGCVEGTHACTHEAKRSAGPLLTPTNTLQPPHTLSPTAGNTIYSGASE